MQTKLVLFGAGGRAGRLIGAEAAARGHAVTSVVRDPARHPDLAAPHATRRILEHATAQRAAHHGTQRATDTDHHSTQRATDTDHHGTQRATDDDHTADHRETRHATERTAHHVTNRPTAQPAGTDHAASQHAAKKPEEHAVVKGDEPRAGLVVVQGDVTDVDSVATVAAGHDVAVAAVYAADTDPGAFYAAAAHALVAGLTAAGVGRLLVVGVATNLEVQPGVRYFEAPDYPADWRPFAAARAEELQILRAAPHTLDWVVVTPPLSLTADAAPRGAYRVGGRALPPGGGQLSYADLARAVVDELETPAHHREMFSVFD